MSSRPAGDVMALLGMRTVGAAALVGVFVLTFGWISWATAAPGGHAANVAAWLLVSAAALVLIRAPGDPLGIRPACVVAAAGPVAGALVFQTLPGEPTAGLQLWPSTAAAALAAYLCVRGRIALAWASTLVVLAVCAGWSTLVGLGPGFGIQASLIDLAPVLMGTFFAYTIRPTARRIYAMRQAGTAAAAEEAAQRAVLAERNRQRGRLDARARPLLEWLAGPEPIEEHRSVCGLVEAGLRDSLRAPVLDEPGILDAAWRARARGVQVVLLDDHGLDDVPPHVRRRVIDAVAPMLDLARTGTVTVRVLPPGRPLLATVVHRDDSGVTRAEYDRTGTRIEGAPTPTSP